jgi:tetratricopeptide (TPR) repeat protein
VAGKEHEPRTVLHLLMREWTWEEGARRFAATANDMGEAATITARHLRRLARAERGEQSEVTPSTGRVLARLFGRPVGELLQPVRGTDLVPDLPATSNGMAPSAGIEGRNLLIMAAQRARRFSLVAGDGGTTAEVIDQLRDDVARLATDYPQRPLGELLGSLVEVQEDLFTLLERRQQPARAQQLYMLSSVVGGMLAKASHDMADPQAAMLQIRTAHLCAQQANHDGLRAWLYGLQSLVSYWAGRYRESARYAEQGGIHATSSGGTAAIWLPASAARAYAALGDSDRTMASIRRAESAWDTVEPSDLDELGGIATFSQARTTYYAAESLAFLPQLAGAAEQYASSAVDAYADSAAPEWSFGDQAGSHAALAIARISRGEVEGASEALSPVLDLPPDQRINGIVHSAQRVHRALTDAQLTAGPGADLQEAIEDFSRRPLPALPH